MKRLFPLLLLSLSCYAEDFTLANGTVLKDAVVLRQGDEELQIRHASGVEKFSYTELSPELQKRFNMTPELVEARRQAEAEAAAEKQRAREAAQAEQQRLLREGQEARLAALEAAGKHARYLCGADVIRMCSGLMTLEARVAEFLAAEWNRREALRLNLEVDTQRFTEEADSLKAEFEKDRKRWESMRSELSDKRAKVQEQAATIKRKNDEIAALRAQISKLNKELGRAESRSSNTTVVVDNPVYIPTYVGPTCVGHIRRPGPRPHVAPPLRPKPARPAPPRPSGIRVSPGPRPASSAHTIPRRR